MNPQLLQKSDNNENVFRVTLPYDFLMPNINHDEPALKRKVIFWGTCFGQLPKDLDIERYVTMVNKCLDYVRQECRGFELYYKPHPAEKDEFKLLNLESFTLLSDPAVGEVFLWKNWDQIAYSFSVMSNATISAYDFGINSYVFYKLFDSVLGRASFESCEWFFQSMPEDFFIKDLGQGLKGNRSLLGKDDFLENKMKNMLNNNKEGRIWFIIVEPALITAMVSLVSLIKQLDPARKTGLIISKQKRWRAVSIDEFKKYFDIIAVFPKISYTLKLSRLFEAIKTALQIRRFDIKPEDIFMGLSHNSLVENCFISYFSENKKIAFFSDIYFDMMYNLRYATFFANSDFKTKLASKLWGLVFEPLLGLYRTIYLQYGDGRVLNITRYRKPMDRIYDEIYLAHLQRG
ncbi:MAG: hypothetical protein A3B99_04145 [Candidatus Yanofskybacteria bacterium RIFCSPHIGHO2_02_FULL_44_12b]|uniref:Uncharacterized protein n=2 Tax=Candidatus Yanofskyibacteriota TaxID=1752733 RepID=A0A1F8GN52_9BACT|nr:MAG: hypothetical protein UW79_C0019G0013 [Candidatus Yanofskybacteria bacterium GW2011_GWA2_44_9]OGN04629.1 MAG: hypothetical protein A2659_00695 [Candidatus Yanofskybacteria bacterium RIFCSPHIGHO2_01_FULL_44_24]OGN15705.1 MAG: hypothetical protein A3B99_04145 [Candidatus Yanofskybacteria bacterium RIFCSPHIGHO2_02_FULL_44_12b]OGN26761.1 MAG: hypothetical protein A2925_04230 [Candidatus Yanofskybacteria bacterium RIFCSPLOWO2_01_FULL_44_22]